jgi:multidrug transporter EmrE-like cation transporter
MLNWAPIVFAVLMAFIDALVMAGIKEYSIGGIKWRSMMPLAMVIYSLQPVFFLQSLQFESMTVMNLLWDVTSDILVTVMGLYYFKETLTPIKRWGIFFAFIAIVLLSYDTIENGKSL